MASSFRYDSDIFQRIVDGARKDVNIYGRCGNPSEYRFEDQMMVIEGADACLATASGMAAISVTLLGLLKSGDHIVCDWTTYSSTHEMLDHRLTDYDIETTFVDTADMAAIEQVDQCWEALGRVVPVEETVMPVVYVNSAAVLKALTRCS